MRNLIVIGVLVITSTSIAHAQIPPAERAALIALYTSTDGDNWTSKTNWNGPVGTECTWFRVSCAGGHVVVLQPYENNLNGTIPAALQDLTELITLDLHANPLLGGTIPVELGNLPNLEWLYLFNANLQGTIPPELGSLGSLQRLLLHQNQLVGTIPPELGNLSNLEWLLMDRNQLTGEIPVELGNLSNLERLYLWENQLYGSIPVELGNLPNLQQLNLNSNQLTGEIPVELGNLLSLQQLILFSNRLTGSIPAVLGFLPSLLQLDLSDNLLTGSIPNELGSLPIVRLIGLNHNQLEGSVPPEFGNLTLVRQLNLAHNHLSGPLPSELGALGSVERFYVESNKLTGQIPVELEGMGLFNSDGLDLRWNGLFNTDPDLGVFLFSKQINDFWETSQTTAPTGLRALRVGDHSIELGWDPVTFLGTYDGGFEVSSVPTSGGVWTAAGRTASKNVLAMPVTGLSPGTSYDLAVATFTSPHVDNENEVLSERSLPVTESTTNTGCPAPVMTLTWSPTGAVLSVDQAGTYEWSTGETTPTITVNPAGPEYFWVWVTVGPCTEAAVILVESVLFADGFESGNTSGWAVTSP